MKRKVSVILALALVLCMICSMFAFVACDEECTEHVDADGDGICDWRSMLRARSLRSRTSFPFAGKSRTAGEAYGKINGDRSVAVPVVFDIRSPGALFSVFARKPA